MDAAGTSRGWKPTPPRLHLSPDEYIDVWRCATNVSAKAVAEFEAILSDDERRRADRLRDPAKGVESIIGRGMLRQVLGSALGRGPQEIEFAVGPHGKPLLAGGMEGTGIGFNVSHTSGLVLVAAAAWREVGADVERVNDAFEWRPVARQFFPAAEAEGLLALPEDEGRLAFFRAWVRKETLLKAAGVGIAFGVELAGGDVLEIDVGAGYAAAVGVREGRIRGVRCWEAPLP